jgi:hypothetical protein
MLGCVNSQSLLVGADRFGFTLDPVELSVLRQAHGVRSRLFPLRLGNTTVDPVRLATLAKAVDQALNRKGLSEDGRLIPPVRTAFELLAEHRVAVSVTGAPGDLAALAVSDGVQALAVTQVTEDELRFALFPSDELIGAVVTVLPQAGAAAGTPVVVGNAFEDRTHTERLTAQLAGPRMGGGLLVASGRGRQGRWTDMLGWVDTSAGRHLVSTANDRSGAFSARYTPAGPAELTAAVTALLETDR